MHVRPSGFAKFGAKMQRNRIANAFYCTVILFISTGVKITRLEFFILFLFCSSGNFVIENIGEKLNV